MILVDLQSENFGASQTVRWRSTSRCTWYFHESQVFRIDHFLGKETARTSSSFRFTNGLFEPIWNRTTSTTSRSTSPRRSRSIPRAGYYEPTGA